MQNNWSEFKLRVNIHTSIEKAYLSWATPKGLESWFLREAVINDPSGNKRKSQDFIEIGDHYEWYWYGYPDNMVEKGRILSANGKDSFSFTFSMGCRVSIFMYTECEETMVEVKETDLPTDEESQLNHYLSDCKGWSFYLTNLKSVLEGGLDLRNKNLELTNVITA